MAHPGKVYNKKATGQRAWQSLQSPGTIGLLRKSDWSRNNNHEGGVDPFVYQTMSMKGHLRERAKVV